MLKYEQFEDHGKNIYDIQQTNSEIYSCSINTQTHSFTIKFKNNLPRKIIEFHYKRHLIRGLDIISFNFPLKNSENSKLVSKSYWFVLYSNMISFSGKIIEGRPKNIFSFNQNFSRYIGEMINGKKEGFGEFSNNDYTYIGMFHNDEFSGCGVKIIKEGTVKYKGTFENSQFHGIIIKKKGGIRKNINYNHGIKENKNKVAYYNNQRSENSPKNGLLLTITSEILSKTEAARIPISLVVKLTQLKEKQSYDSKSSNETKYFNSKSGFRLPLCDEWLIHEKNLINGAKKPMKNDIASNEKKVLKRFNNGEVYKGMTYLKRLNGFGVYYYKNGMIYKGEFFNGKREGIGAIFYGNIKVVEGKWKNNMLHGFARVLKENLSMKCFYHEGDLIDIINITLRS